MQKKKNNKKGKKLWRFFIFILLLAVLISILIIILPKLPETTEQDHNEVPPPLVQNIEEILPVRDKTTPQKPPEQPASVDQTKPPEPPAEQIKPAETKPVEAKPVETKPVEAKPVEAKPVETKPVETKPVNTRDRSIYFMSETNSGEMQLTKVIRNIEVSVSPLTDCINSLLRGPTAAETNRGLISLIPAKSRLISAQITSNIAYLNFNDDFRYNAFGREAQSAQIKQIVYTATEFETVKSVQFLIEGKKVDFLPEGVMIRDPLGR